MSAGSDPARLRLVYGHRDTIEVLEGLIALAKRGELLGLVACTVEARDDTTATFAHMAWHEDLEQPWSRLVASVAAAQHDLLAEGL